MPNAASLEPCIKLEYEGSWAASEYERGGNQTNLYEMQHTLRKETHPTSLLWWVLQLAGRENDVQRYHTCRPIWVKSWFNWNQMQNMQSWAGSGLQPLVNWHVSSTATIKERTLGHFSRNVKKLKPILMSLLIVMFSPQNITGITGWGKWVIRGPDSVLGSRRMMSLNVPVRRELRAALPSISVTHGEKTKCKNNDISQGKR